MLALLAEGGRELQGLYTRMVAPSSAGSLLQGYTIFDSEIVTQAEERSVARVDKVANAIGAVCGSLVLPLIFSLAWQLPPENPPDPLTLWGKSTYTLFASLTIMVLTKKLVGEGVCKVLRPIARIALLNDIRCWSVSEGIPIKDLKLSRN